MADQWRDPATRDSSHRHRLTTQPKESCSPGDLSYTSDRLLFASVGVSLLCCTVLLVDVIWRYRPGKARSPPRDWPEGPPPTTPAHHVPLEAFESLDTGAENMMSLLQMECNMLSAKIDRCAVTLSDSQKGHKGAAAAGSKPDPTPQEIGFQWENLRWFHHFVGVHLGNADVYQQFHARVSAITGEMTTHFPKLGSVLQTDGRSNGSESLANITRDIDRLWRTSSSVLDLMETSHRVMPLHKRIRDSNKEEPLLVLSLCDYKKNKMAVREGDPLTVVLQLNNYTWKVRTEDGIEGAFPAVCCVLPVPDHNTMLQARSVAHDFAREWAKYEKKCRQKLCLWLCYALSQAALEEDVFDTVSDVAKRESRNTLAFIEYTLTADQYQHVLGPRDRKVIHGVIHQVYELLNARGAAEETRCYIRVMRSGSLAVRSLKRLLQCVTALRTWTVSLDLKIAEARQQKLSLPRQPSPKGAPLSKSPRQISHSGQDPRYSQPQMSQVGTTILARRQSSTEDRQIIDDVIESLVAASSKDSESSGSPSKCSPEEAMSSPPDDPQTPRGTRSGAQTQGSYSEGTALSIATVAPLNTIPAASLAAGFPPDSSSSVSDRTSASTDDDLEGGRSPKVSCRGSSLVRKRCTVPRSQVSMEPEVKAQQPQHVPTRQIRVMSSDSDLSLNMSLSIDEEDEYDQAQLEQNAQPNVDLKEVQTITLDYEEHESFSETVRFITSQQPTKGSFTIRAVRDPNTGEELALDEASKRKIIDTRYGIYRNTPTSRILSFQEAVSNGYILISSTGGKDGGEPRPATILKVFLQRQPRSYAIRQVVDPRTKAFVPVDVAVKAGILIEQNERYRNPTTADEISLDVAFARGLLIVDHAADDDVIPSAMTYRRKDAEATTKLVAIYGVLDSSSGHSVSLDEAFQRGIVDPGKGTLHDVTSGETVLFGEAIKKGMIDLTTVDNSDLEALARHYTEVSQSRDTN